MAIKRDKYEKELQEKIADQIHQQWIHWMRYLFSQSIEQKNGDIFISQKFIQRWRRQMETEYAKLPEEEKKVIGN